MKLPVHVAIIPDGNRRWARARGLNPSEGHRVAAEKRMPEILRKARELGIKYLTIWGLSTENLKKRSKAELNFLFKMFKKLIEKNLPEMIKEKVRFNVIGKISELPQDVQQKIAEAKEKTKNFEKYYFTLALNYGGRDEILRAVNAILQDGLKEVDEKEFSRYLDTYFMPDPDLIIRTGKEKRVSGFMLWQSQYSEYFFSDKYFPEFTADDFEAAIKDFLQRERRFGA